MIRNTTNTVLAWSNAEPDEVSKRFWNYLMYEAYDYRRGWPELQKLLDLFAVPVGPRIGRYGHHDGWRCP